MKLDEKLKKSDRLEVKPTYYITEYIWRVLIVQKFILLPLAKTNITPNQVTIFGGFCIIGSFILLYLGHNVLSGILFLIYSISDHTDGTLSRLKNQSTKLGYFLDYTCDYIAWFGLIILASYLYNVSIFCTLFIISTLLFHQQFCKHFIHKRLKKLNKIYRFGLKKYLLERGILLGIDASLLAIVLSIAIFSLKFELCFYALGMIYLIDLIYRSTELYYNIKLNGGGGKWRIKLI